VTHRTPTQLEFPGGPRRHVEVSFTGGDITSDGGVMLLRQADRATGLLKAVSRVLGDGRRRKSCRHSALSMVRQRVYGIAQGYEDLNDHDVLRDDVALQTAVNRDAPLASAPTLCRMENRADRATAWALHEVLVDQFIASHARAPKELVLDFDATDDPVHGEQEGRFFHGYYDHYCFLPLYVFCGEQLLVSYLRPSKIDGAKHAGAILKLLVTRLRETWPDVRIVFRGDSGFCRHWLLGWCERNGVDYIVGIARNPRLQRFSQELGGRAESEYEATGDKQRLFGEFRYAAASWKRERRVIAKAEHSDYGANPRYIVTNMNGDAQRLYDDVYCVRGDMENRIKEQQLGLFSGRTSCHRWWANQYRLLLASLAYTLLETIRRVGLKGTELARAQCTTLRITLLKVGAVIIRNTRRVRILMPSAWPSQHLFTTVATRLDSS